PSGVNKNIGRIKIRYQSAEKGPVIRASSPCSGSRPNQGVLPSNVFPSVGLPDKNSRTTNRTTRPPTYPNTQPRFETRPISASDTSRGIMESLTMIENSVATVASTIHKTGNYKSEPGSAHHTNISALILTTAKTAIQGLRVPVASAIEPSTGASSATMIPEMVMV